MREGIVQRSGIMRAMNGRDAHDLPLTQLLTPREEEVLTLLGEDLSNRQIAEELIVALSTAKWYVRQIYNKLGVNNREEAIARARDLDLLPPKDQGGRIRHNIPLAAMPFVGREGELATLADLIADPQARIITITGPGGMGKTRLALEAAGRELRKDSQFSDGIFFVSLAPLEAAEEIVSALATALDFHFQDSGNETEQLLSYLRNKQMLLVMDNFEHILDSRALLAEINKRAAEVTLLVTSRERLQMRREQLFPLQGLTLPQSAAYVEKAPAAQLFLNICRRVLPDFQLLEGDDEQILRICQLVEGMPLGLELAASWAGLLPLPEIAAEIEQSLRVLSSELHDAPVRHQSMRAALDVSWAMLSKEKKRAFQELTVFRGGFTRAAALEVADASLPILVTLVNKSWLSYNRQNDRYQIHELLRQYGADRLSADLGHEQLVHDRHSAYFCSYLQEREKTWYGPQQKEVAAEVRCEIDNVQRAWRRAAAQGQHTLLAQGLHSLCRFFIWEGNRSEGQKACDVVAEGLSKMIARQGVAEEQCLTVWSQALAWESEFVTEMDRREELLSMSQQLLDRATQAGGDSRDKQAFASLQKAKAAGNKDYETAIEFGMLALEEYREIGDLHGQSEALSSLGVNHLFLGHFEQARDHLSENLAITEQLEDRRGIAITLTNLGLVAQHQGEYAHAERLHRQGLSLHKQLQNRYLECLALTVLSFTQSWAGNFPQARETARLALEIDREVGNIPNLWRFIALTLTSLHLGLYEETVALAKESLDLARQRDHPTEKGFALMFLGAIDFVEGKPDAAADKLLESVSLMVALRYVYQALPRASLILVARALGDRQTARQQLQSALRSGIAYRSTTPIMYCLPAAALLAVDDGNPVRGMELYGLAQGFGHITNSCWFADVACKELDRVRASLPVEKAAAAEARGRELDVWETAETLLQEPDGR